MNTTVATKAFTPAIVWHEGGVARIRADRVRIGDMLDLEGDAIADPDAAEQDHESPFGFEYEIVCSIKRETGPDGLVIVLDFDSGFACGFPADHEIEVAEHHAMLRASFDMLTEGNPSEEQRKTARHSFEIATQIEVDDFYKGLDAADAVARESYAKESATIFPTACEIAKGYVTTALWVGVEHRSGDPRGDGDKNMSLNPCDIEPGSLRQMIQQAESWASVNADLIARVKAAGFRCGPDYNQDEHIGHDLWLTSNGHGAGFWDGDYPKPFGDELTEAAKILGEHDLFTNTTGTVELM